MTASEATRLSAIEADIIRLDIDPIVNAANTSRRGSTS